MAIASRTRIRQRPTARHWDLRSTLADALVFLIAFTSSYSVRFVGSLPVSEIILIPLVPIFLILGKRRPVQPTLKAIFFLMGLWLFGQIVTDLYRETPAADWMRGDAAIVFFALDLAGLTVLLAGNERRKTVFLAGLAIGTLLATRLFPSQFAQDEPWKFGYSGGTIMMVVLISCYFYGHRRYLIVAFLFAGIISVNLVENYRSPSSIFLSQWCWCFRSSPSGSEG